MRLRCGRLTARSFEQVPIDGFVELWFGPVDDVVCADLRTSGPLYG